MKRITPNNQPTTVCTLYLVRHGESIANHEHLVSGHFDSPLTERGQLQAREAHEKLRKVHFAAAYSSDLQRARETAEIIIGKRLDSVSHLAGLRERSFGKLEGLPSEHLERLYETHQSRFDRLSEDEKWSYVFADDIETDMVVYSRFSDTLTKIAQQHMGENVLVVTHGGCIRMFLFQLKFAKPEEIPRGTFQNAGYVKVAYNGHAFKVLELVGAKKQSVPKS